MASKKHGFKTVLHIWLILITIIRLLYMTILHASVIHVHLFNLKSCAPSLLTLTHVLQHPKLKDISSPPANIFSVIWWVSLYLSILQNIYLKIGGCTKFEVFHPPFNFDPCCVLQQNSSLSHVLQHQKLKDISPPLEIFFSVIWFSVYSILHIYLNGRVHEIWSRAPSL